MARRGHRSSRPRYQVARVPRVRYNVLAKAGGEPMADIFISYKRQERTRIVPLAQALESLGYTVWWDLELIAGEKWKRRIKSELDAARCVIVTWTVQSVGEDGLYASEWIEKEAEEGHARGVLVPAQLDKGRVAWDHKQVQYADLTDWRGAEDHAGLQVLIEGIVRLAGTRQRPPNREAQAWGNVEANPSLHAYKQFVIEFPSSRFADQGRSRISELEEVGDWLVLKEGPAIAELESFLKKWPAGRFADTAATRIASAKADRKSGSGIEEIQEKANIISSSILQSRRTLIWGAGGAFGVAALGIAVLALRNALTSATEPSSDHTLAPQPPLFSELYSVRTAISDVQIFDASDSAQAFVAGQKSIDTLPATLPLSVWTSAGAAHDLSAEDTSPRAWLVGRANGTLMSPSGARILTSERGSENPKWRLRNSTTGVLVGEDRGTNGPFSANGDRFLVIGRKPLKPRLELRDSESGQLIRDFLLPENMTSQYQSGVVGARFTRDGQGVLCLCDAENSLHFFRSNAPTPHWSHEFGQHGSFAYQHGNIQLDEAERIAAVDDSYGGVAIFEMASGRKIRTIRPELGQGVPFFLLSHDGRFLIVRSHEEQANQETASSLSFWSISDGTLLGTSPGDIMYAHLDWPNYATRVILSKKQEAVLVLHPTGALAIHDYRGAVVSRVEATLGEIRGMAVLESADVVVLANRNGTIAAHDIRSGSEVARLMIDGAEISSLYLPSSADPQLAIGQADGKVSVFSLAI
jgi:hypothetical protein